MAGLIRNPLLVDGIVVARQHAHDLSPAHIDANVRADGVHDIDRFVLGHLPRTGIECPRAMRQRPDRADIDHIGRQFRHHTLFQVRGDFHVLAAADGA